MMSNDGLCHLPELPNGIRILTNDESERLRLTAGGSNAPTSVKHCPTCQGTRRFRWYLPEGESLDKADEMGAAEYECPCEDQLVMHRYFLWSGIGTAYQRLRWADGTAVEPGAVQAARYWLDNGDAFMRTGTGLLMTGNRGTGKTFLSALMLKEMLARGYAGYFTTFPDLITMLLSGWQSEDAMRWYYAKCRDTPLLVVDDVGREIKQTRKDEEGNLRRFSAASAEFALESVLRHRIAMALPTIITTNFTVEQMRQQYGDHFKSLLTEAAQQYAFVGGDFRIEAGSRRRAESTAGLIRPVVVG